ncbi:MAG: hypothetical protein JWL87_192 [Candidatus Adlerbacteria bacterium]|nr:hypothetical protein [Candidatus Adlerbacteria bacterium]
MSSIPKVDNWVSDYPITATVGPPMPPSEQQPPVSILQPSVLRKWIPFLVLGLVLAAGIVAGVVWQEKHHVPPAPQTINENQLPPLYANLEWKEIFPEQQDIYLCPEGKECGANDYQRGVFSVTTTTKEYIATVTHSPPVAIGEESSAFRDFLRYYDERLKAAGFVNRASIYVPELKGSLEFTTFEKLSQTTAHYGRVVNGNLEMVIVQNGQVDTSDCPGRQKNIFGQCSLIAEESYRVFSSGPVPLSALYFFQETAESAYDFQEQYKTASRVFLCRVRLYTESGCSLFVSDISGNDKRNLGIGIDYGDFSQKIQLSPDGGKLLVVLEHKAIVLDTVTLFQKIVLYASPGETLGTYNEFPAFIPYAKWVSDTQVQISIFKQDTPEPQDNQPAAVPLETRTISIN